MKHLFTKYTLVAILGLALTSCLDGTAKFDETADTPVTNNDLPFNGIDSVSDVLATTATLHWTGVPMASGYHVFNTTSGFPVFVAFVLAPTESYNLTNLNPSSTYKFRVNALTSNGLLDVNMNNFGFSTTAPTNDISFAGIDTISDVTSTTATIRWTHNALATSYKIYNMTTGSPVLVATVSAPTQTYNLTGLASNSTFIFRVNAIANNLPDGNTNNFGFSTIQSVNNLSFAGVDSVTVTDTTATLHWTHNPAAVAYQVYNVTSGAPLFVTFLFAPTALYNLSGLTPNSTYKYRVNAIDITGFPDANSNDFQFTMNSAPAIPTGVSLIYPTILPGLNPTPIVRVSGVKNGDLVKVYSNSSCTTQVGSGTASSTSVDITLSSLTAGSYSFYANATGSNASNCSTAHADYTLNSCPSGYIPVSGNLTLGTANFCVMKYEAKAWRDTNADTIIDAGEVDADGCNEPGCTTANWATAPTYKPISMEANLPWRRISQTQANNACGALNSMGGTNYDLISNPEWQTLAREIELRAVNWSGSAVGVGSLFQGNNGLVTASGYNGSDPEGGSGRNAKALHVLIDNDEIWDLAGNVWEWVDWSVVNTQKASVGGTPVNGWVEFNLLDSNIGLANPMFPNSWSPTTSTYNNTQGIGQYYSGTSGSGGATIRGGSSTLGVSTGIFSLSLDITAGNTSASIGFRCVFRP